MYKIKALTLKYYQNYAAEQWKNTKEKQRSGKKWLVD